MKSTATGAAGDLIEHVRFAVHHVMGKEEDENRLLFEAIHANVLRTMGDLGGRSSVIASAIQEGDLTLIGALFSLESGKVSVLEMPDRRFR